jgi:hypothetical protein
MSSGLCEEEHSLLGWGGQWQVGATGGHNSKGGGLSYEVWVHVVM